MSIDGFRGFDATQALFNELPDAAREELGDLLADIAQQVLKAQQAAVPVLAEPRRDRDQGALLAGLVADLQLAQLRARIGLLSFKKGRNDLFYGRFVDEGVSPSTVTVQRRRRVGGRLRTQSRGSRKRASDIVSTYTLHVRARPAQPFVDAPDVDAIAAGMIDDFWDRAFARADEAAA